LRLDLHRSGFAGQDGTGSRSPGPSTTGSSTGCATASSTGTARTGTGSTTGSRSTGPGTTGSSTGCANIRRHLRGEAPIGLVDRTRGY
jgi:hypothetical protein